MMNVFGRGVGWGGGGGNDVRCYLQRKMRFFGG